MEKLQRLNITGTGITEEGFQMLKHSLPNLQIINYIETQQLPPKEPITHLFAQGITEFSKNIRREIS